MSLLPFPHALGWDSGRDEEFAAWSEGAYEPGRIARPDRSAHVVLTAGGHVRASVSPRLLRDAAPGDRSVLPTVGDWVVLDRAGDEPAVVAVLARRSSVVRHTPGGPTEAHVLAANVDVVFVVVGLSVPPNLRRLERLLTVAWDSGATPVVLLTKADLRDDVDELVAAVRASAPGVAVHALSVVTGTGLDELGAHLAPGRTVALVGASGVGKSTLVNHLLGAERLATREVRSDGKGRHTTTHRELVPLPGGAALIDTPGLRGIRLWDAGDGLDRAFADVEGLAADCRFRDCGHTTEPGCALLAALEAGLLDHARVESHRRLQRELAHLAAKQDARLRSEQRNHWRIVAKAQRRRGFRP